MQTELSVYREAIPGSSAQKLLLLPRAGRKNCLVTFITFGFASPLQSC